MNFSLLVTAEPGSDTESALAFGRAVVAAEHRLYRVFFYGAGTLCGHKDSLELTHWQKLAKDHDVDLVLCSTSAQRRGLFADMEKEPTVINGFSVSGLGQLVDATVQSDRLITFS